MANIIVYVAKFIVLFPCCSMSHISFNVTTTSSTTTTTSTTTTSNFYYSFFFFSIIIIIIYIGRFINFFFIIFFAFFLSFFFFLRSYSLLLLLFIFPLLLFFFLFLLFYHTYFSLRVAFVRRVLLLLPLAHILLSRGSTFRYNTHQHPSALAQTTFPDQHALPNRRTNRILLNARRSA